MTDEETVTIQKSEYEHLKQIKQDHLDALQNEIRSLQTEMLSQGMSSIITRAIKNK